MKKVAKVQVVAELLLNFVRCQPGVACKSVAYLKNRVMKRVEYHIDD